MKKLDNRYHIRSSINFVYTKWKHMCNVSETNKDITICEEWKDFITFSDFFVKTYKIDQLKSKKIYFGLKDNCNEYNKNNVYFYIKQAQAEQKIYKDGILFSNEEERFVYYMWRDLMEKCDNNVYLTMCRSWRLDFIVFYNWIKENHDINRIMSDKQMIKLKDDCYEYSPDNCVFVKGFVKEKAESLTNNGIAPIRCKYKNKLKGKYGRSGSMYNRYYAMRYKCQGKYFTMCDEWDSYDNFFDWVNDNFDMDAIIKEYKTLGFKDITKLEYSPENCTFLTKSEAYKQIDDIKKYINSLN